MSTQKYIKIGGQVPIVLKEIACTLKDKTATDASLQEIVSNIVGLARTTGILRPTGAGNVNTVAAQFYSVSVANTGLADGEVLGEVIRPGEILNFAADSLNNYFTSFDYDATGTDFLITFVY